MSGVFDCPEALGESYSWLFSALWTWEELRTAYSAIQIDTRAIPARQLSLEKK